jgi:hypothetical protein
MGWVGKAEGTQLVAGVDKLVGGRWRGLWAANVSAGRT